MDRFSLALGKKYERARVSLIKLSEKLADAAILESTTKSTPYKPGKYKKSTIFNRLTDDESDALKDLKSMHFNQRIV